MKAEELKAKFIDDYIDENIIKNHHGEMFAKLDNLLDAHAQSQNKELRWKLDKERGKWSVDEIIEELKNIDAFGAAKYFFDKFNPNPYDEI